MRRNLKSALARALRWSGCDRVIGSLSGAQRLPFIVGYHRVVEDFQASAGSCIPAMLTSARMLEQHIDWIARRFRVVTLDELGARLEAGDLSSERLAAITFDDGYADAYHLAFPMLMRKGIPAAFFVVTDLVGTDRVQTYDRLYLAMVKALRQDGHPARGLEELLGEAGVHGVFPTTAGGRQPGPAELMRALLISLPQAGLVGLLGALESRFPPTRREAEPLRSLTWEMLSEMHLAGMTIGSHTRSHALLTMESGQRAHEEVAGSRVDLQRRLRLCVNHLAYPDGRFDREIVATAAQAGYRFGYGVCRHRDPAHPLLTIPRKLLWERSCVDASGRFSPSIMSCQAEAVFDPLTPCRQDHGVAASRAVARPERPQASAVREEPPRRRVAQP